MNILRNGPRLLKRMKDRKNVSESAEEEYLSKALEEGQYSVEDLMTMLNSKNLKEPSGAYRGYIKKVSPYLGISLCRRTEST